MSDKPDMVFDEPTATGWLRAEFFGDTELGKEYVGDARKQLGGMRSRYGVNERIASGDAGGFYRQLDVLPDGTQIETLTNGGQDTIRITAASEQQAASEELTTGGEATAFEGEATAFAFEPEPPEFPRTEFTPPPVPSLEPYLWVGIRQLNNRLEHGVSPSASPPYVTLHCCLFEPGASDQDGAPMVLSNQWQFTSPVNRDPVKVPLRPNLVRKALTDPDTGAQYGDLYYTDHLLYLVDRNAPTDNANAGLIYDPAPDPLDPVEWDFVFVLDPNEGQALMPDTPYIGEKDPYDDRGIIPDDAMENETGIVGQGKIISGDYALKIMAAGDDCNPLPTQVRIDVITLKGDYSSRDTFTVDIAGNSDLLRGILPGGYDPTSADVCSALTGPNPHRDHWWPGAILLNPWGLAKREDQYVPDWGFQPGAGWPSSESLCGALPTSHYAYVFQINVTVRGESILVDPGYFDLTLVNNRPPKYIWLMQIRTFTHDMQALATYLHDFERGGLNILSNQSGTGRTSVADVLAALPTSFTAYYGAAYDYSLGTYPAAPDSGWVDGGTTSAWVAATDSQFDSWLAAFHAPLDQIGGSSFYYIYDGKTNTCTATSISTGTEMENYLRSAGFTHAVYGSVVPNGPPPPPAIVPLYAPQGGNCA